MAAYWVWDNKIRATAALRSATESACFPDLSDITYKIKNYAGDSNNKKIILT